MRYTSLVALLWLAACGKTDSDTDVGDTDSPADTDVEDTDDTDVPTDTDVEDTDDTDVPTTDWTVCDDGIAPFDDLQDAIDAATEGDTILVCHGTYGPVEIRDTNLTIIGEGPLFTKLDGRGEVSMTIDTAVVDLSGVTITNSRVFSGVGVGIDAYDSTVTVHDARVADVPGDNYGPGAILQFQEGTTTIERVEFEDNILRGGMLDIAYGGGPTTIRHNTFHGNGGYAGLNFYDVDYTFENNLIFANDSTVIGQFDDTSGGRVANNTWYDNHGPGGNGPVVDVDEGVVFTNNIILDNAGGVGGFNEPTYTLSYGAADGLEFRYGDGDGNLEDDPEFVDPENGDFHLMSGSPAIDAGNPDSDFDDADGSRSDMGAYGGPHGDW